MWSHTFNKRVALGILTFACAASSLAYVPDDRWSTTTSGSTGNYGDPATLAWSLVPDGTRIPGEENSNLINYLDDLFNVSANSTDLTNRPWFSLVEESFTRWSDLSGLTFVYEPNDTGSSLETSSGVLGTRGDIRIGGAYLDGADGTLAYAYLPDIGDLVVDTGETTFYSNSSNNYLHLRNVLMHEIGHALGLLHVESSSESLLMEPTINLSIDGPQLDEIRGIQGLYGDAYEKSNNGLGNGSYLRATDLGQLVSGGDLAIGTDATGGQTVLATESDFVSISESTDYDYYSFTIDAASLVDLTLTPLGGVFSQAVEGGAESVFDANSRNDLQLALYDTDGTTLLKLANETGLGGVEQLSNLELSSAGTYYARVSGSTSSMQLYELQLSATAPIITETGDFNGDGLVNLADYTAWRNLLGNAGANLAADGNSDNVVDAADYAIWKVQFGTAPADTITGVAGVPEPSSLALLGLAAVAALHSQRQRCAP